MPAWVAKYAHLPLGAAHGVVEDMFFTNFFVSRVDWWFHQDVQRFLAAVNKTGSVYSHRWGDAPIQTTALKLFAPAAAVGRLPTDCE